MRSNTRRRFLKQAMAPLVAGSEGAALAQAAVRDYCLETELSPSTAAICYPADGGYAEIAQRISRDIEKECGGPLETRPIQAEDRARPKAPRNLILLGNAINNPLIFQLYVNHYTLVDEYFPGPGGDFVHSVHNPFGDQRNAVILGASDVAGASAAARVLVEKVRALGPKLEFLLHSRSSRMRYDLPPRSDFAHALRARKEQVERDDLPWATSDYGMLYHLTGQREWGELFREIHLHAIRVSRDRGVWPDTAFSSRLNIGYFYLYRVLTSWDLIEESPLFSAEDRRELEGLFLEISRFVASLDYFKGKLTMGNNHQTYAALSCYFAHRYFSKYYGNQEFASKQPAVKAIFAMHNRSWRPNDNEEGTSVRTHRHLVNYSLLHGDLTYFSTGRSQRLADWIVMVTDNRADTMPFGDAGEYDGSYRGGPKHIQAQRSLALLSLAAWYSRDPRYAWARDWYRKGLDWKDRLDYDQLLSKKLGWQQRYGIKEWEFYIPMLFRMLPHAQPTHLLGVTVARFDDAAREMAKVQDFPPEEPFDKLTFRAGFDRRDEYLALEGCSTLPHSHQDTNCIMRLSWRDRLWIVEGDEHKNLRRYHNGIVVTRNGEHFKPPSVARLRASGSSGRWGFSKSLLPDDNGMDWERNVFWRQGEFFVIWDRLTAARDGEYTIECLWRTLGEVELNGRELKVSQDGETFLFSSADESAWNLSLRGCLYQPDREAYRTYEHAATGFMRVLRQSQRRTMKIGDRLEFFTLCQVTTGRQPARVQKRSPGILVVDNGEQLLLGAGDGNRLFAMDSEGTHSPPGSAAFYDPAHNTAEKLPKPVEASSAVITPKTPERQPIWKVSGASEISSWHVNEDWIAAGDTKGKIRVLDHAGRLKWSMASEAPISSVRVLHGGSLAFGARDASLSLLDSSGRMKWKKELGRGIRQRMRVPVALLPFEGDLVAGLEDQTLFRFDLGGKEIWHAQARYHAITRLERIPFGGRPHLLVGTEYYALNLFDDRGNFVWRKLIGPVTALAAQDLDGDGAEEILYADWMGLNALRPKDSSVIWSVNMGGEVLNVASVTTSEGSVQIYTASDIGQVACLCLDGTRVWRLDAGEPLTSMAAGKTSLALGTLSGRVQIRNLNSGRLQSVCNLDSPVLRLAMAPGEGDSYFGGTEKGAIFRI